MKLDLPPSVDPKDFYFSIHHTDPPQDLGFVGTILNLTSDFEVVMTRRKYWDEKGHLQDTSGLSSPDRVAEGYGLLRLMDSTYEIPRLVGNDIGWLKQRLQEAGFIWNPEMSTKFKRMVTL